MQIPNEIFFVNNDHMVMKGDAGKSFFGACDVIVCSSLPTSTFNEMKKVALANGDGHFCGNGLDAVQKKTQQVSTVNFHTGIFHDMFSREIFLDAFL